MATQTLTNVILQLRSGSASQWEASTRILKIGEPGVETETGRIKIGDGTHLWSELPWSGSAIEKSSINGSLQVNGADLVVYTLPVASINALGGIRASSGVGGVQVDQVGQAVVKEVDKASKLSNARSISLSGDVTGSTQFDGSTNVNITTALPNQSITPGTYTKVTINSKGIVTNVEYISASDIPNGIPVSKLTGLGTAATKNTGISAGNIPVLGTSGKLDTAILPALAITDTNTVTSKTDMTKLSAQRGDVCVITAGNDRGSYILTSDDPSKANNWQPLISPSDAVSSVNGKVGTVVLTTSNITEGSNLYWTESRFNQAFSAKSSTDLADGSTILHSTDPIVINCGSAES